MADENAVSTQTPKPQISFGQRGIELQNLDQAVRFAEGIVRSGMAPKGMQPGGVVALIQAGQEIGLPPMWALSNLTFVNGRLGIMGTASMALVRQSGALAEGTDIVPRWEGEGDRYACTLYAKRKGASEWASASFSVAEAKKAKLWGKQGPWSDYQDDMLMWRAWGRLSKREFSDVTMGLAPLEELRDHAAPPIPGTPPERDVTPPSTPDPLLEAATTPAEPAEPEPEATGESATIDAEGREAWPEEQDESANQGSLIE